MEQTCGVDERTVITGGSYAVVNVGDGGGAVKRQSWFG